MQNLGNFTDVAEFACKVCEARTNELSEIQIPCGYRSLADTYCPVLLACAKEHADILDEPEAEIMYIDGIAGSKPDTFPQTIAKKVRKAANAKIGEIKTAYAEAHQPKKV